MLQSTALAANKARSVIRAASSLVLGHKRKGAEWACAGDGACAIFDRGLQGLRSFAIFHPGK